MNDKDNIATEFKYPSRWPVVFILLIIACVVGVRWYMKRQKAMAHPVAVMSSINIASSNALPAKPSVKVNQPVAKASSAANTIDAPAKPGEIQGGTGILPVIHGRDVHATRDFATSTDSCLIDSNIIQVVQQAIRSEESKNIAEARTKYTSVLKTIKDPALLVDVEQRLGLINCELVLTPVPMPEKQQYVVKSGDSLEKVAKKYGTTVELIRKSNLLRSDVIKAGDRLMILTGKFAIKVRKAKNDMMVTLNDEFFARFGVGTGKFGKTPIGSFVINDKIKEPVWWRPDGKQIPFGDPENILGTRWMSIKASGAGTPDVSGYGIHGTWDESSIGKSESAGCIRMRNSEVEQLFMMVPVGTVVTITEQ